MDSPSTPHRDSWTQSRLLLQQRLVHSPLFAIPLQVIDWAVARELPDWTYSWLSHDHLVISNRRWDAVRAARLVVIPKQESVELRLYRDGVPIRRVSINSIHLAEELDRLLPEFS